MAGLQDVSERDFEGRTRGYGGWTGAIRDKGRYSILLSQRTNTKAMSHAMQSYESNFVLVLLFDIRRT
jgi:hypothetical protein